MTMKAPSRARVKKPSLKTQTGLSFNKARTKEAERTIGIDGMMGLATTYLADRTMREIMDKTTKLAELFKNPIGAGGLNAQPSESRDIVVKGEAVGAVTNSCAQYVYRAPRKRVADAVQYTMKRMITGNRGTSGGSAQNVYDINILDAEPVTLNPGNNNDYSHLTIRHAFDKYLRGEFGSNYSADVHQASIHVKSLSSDLVLTNKETTTVFVDIYELVPQHCLGPTEYVSAEKASGYMSPTWTYEQGLDIDTAGSGDVISLEDPLLYTDPASNPFNSTVFSRTWKVVKHVRANITGNGTHRHKSAYAINKTVSYQEMAQFSTQGGKFAYWNPTYMIVQRGVPTGSNTVGTSSVDYSCNMQLNYEATPDRQAKVIVFDTNT